MKEYKIILVRYIQFKNGIFEEDYDEIELESDSEENAFKKAEELMINDPNFRYLYEGGFIISSVDEIKEV